MQVDEATWRSLDKTHRQDLLAGVVRDCGWAVPPSAVRRNWQLETGVSISYKTVRRYLQELAERGELRAISAPGLDDMEVRAAGPDERTWYAPADLRA